MAKNWIDRLSEAGQKAKAEKTPPKPKPQVHQIQITTRHADPDVGDPGACRIGHYFVDSLVVFLSSEDGVALMDAHGNPFSLPLEHPGSDPRALASILLRQRVRSGRTTGFEPGRLPYPRLGWM